MAHLNYKSSKDVSGASNVYLMITGRFKANGKGGYTLGTYEVLEVYGSRTLARAQLPDYAKVYGFKVRRDVDCYASEDDSYLMIVPKQLQVLEARKRRDPSPLSTRIVRG